MSVEHEEFQINIERDGERYAVNLPWKSDAELLTDHYDLSKTRLNYLQQSLKKDMDLMEKYNAIIEEQRESGIIEPVLNENKREQTNSKVHYMPHHAVVREDKSTTKVRIVFNVNVNVVFKVVCLVTFCIRLRKVSMVKLKTNLKLYFV